MNLRQPPKHDPNKPIILEVKESKEIETNVFRALRDTSCDHDWIPDGHDSHHDFYKCSKCKLRTQI